MLLEARQPTIRLASGVSTFTPADSLKAEPSQRAIYCAPGDRQAFAIHLFPNLAAAYYWMMPLFLVETRVSRRSGVP
ncbi:MAG: hypothetical protein WC284_05565 [Candidimonas sp.]|jgi:hypothetical protein